MTLLDEAVGSDRAEGSGADVPPPPPPARAGRRWLIYLVLALILLVTIGGIVLIGIDNASAAGGCGGG